MQTRYKMCLHYLKRFTPTGGSTYCRRQMQSFGVLMAINFPLFAWLQHEAINLTVEAVIGRAMATGLCLLLAINRWWPVSLQRYVNVYYLITISVCLPGFFTYFSLVNAGNGLWLMNWMSAVFFLYLLLDAWQAVCVLLLGMAVAYLVYHLVHGPIVYHPIPVTAAGVIVSLSSACVIGSVFSGHRDQIVRHQLSGMRLLAGSIAHELRTPLASIQAAMQACHTYLPRLLRVYQDAAGPKPPMRQRQMTALQHMPNRISQEITQLHFIIDSVLTQINFQHNAARPAQPFSVDATIRDALARYPYASAALQDSVHYHCLQDFSLHGEPELLVHVMFNLVKNALYFITTNRGGELYISVTTNPKGQPEIIVKDTACGIAKADLPHIFERFYSRRPQGTGIGLAFCQSVVQAFAGTIHCQSQLGQYTRFVMRF